MINIIAKNFIHKSNLDMRQNREEYQYSYMIFCQQLSDHIQDVNFNNFNNFIHFLNSTESIRIMMKFPYDVLVTIVSILDNTHESKKENYFCTKALYFLATYCDPSELSLYLIEQMELTKSYHSFYFLLNALETSLKRSKKLLNVIDMITDIIRKFLINLPVLHDQTNCEIYDNIVECVIVSYINISNFIDNLCTNCIFQSNNVVVETKVKYLLLDFLVSMFDKPICFLNINQEYHDLIFHKIFKNISLIKCDIINFFCFFNYRTEFMYSKFHWLNISTINLFLNINTLSLCNFLWSALYKRDTRKIQVYNPSYVAYSCINLSNHFISLNNFTNIIIIKSFDIINYGLNMIKHFLIPFEALDLSIHKKLIQNLTSMIIYNHSVQIKKNALHLFVQYINLFENKAKFIIITKLIDLKEHYYIIGIVIGIFKNILDRILVKNEQEIQSNKYFLNENLEILVLKICLLSNEAEVNLLEISDELITILNFIIFLIIRSRTYSGMENCLKHIKCNFLPSIENILPLEKHKWISRLNDLKEKKIEKFGNNKEIFDIELPFVPLEQKIESCNQAITTLLLIENILNRIHELMDTNFDMY